MTTTLTEWSDLHLAACRDGHTTRATPLSPTTCKQYHHTEQDFITWVGTDAPDALSLTNARAWLTYLRSPARGLSETTVKLYATCLKVWAAWLEQEEIVADNPIRKLKLPLVYQPVIEIFTPEQVQALLTVAREGPQPERDTALLYFAFDTMIRSGELREATIPPTWTGAMTILGKGRKQRRIYYQAETAARVRDYLATRRDHQPWLFLDNGHQFGPFAFIRILRELGWRANIRGVRCSPHTCRHTGAVRFLQAHPDNLAQLKARLGHATLDMTLRYATRATEESILSDNGTSALDLLGLNHIDTTTTP